MLVDATIGYSTFPFVDYFSGYNQIKIHPCDVEKTVIKTPMGNFQYIIMHMVLRMLEQLINE